MKCKDVTTQAELDAALAGDATCIHIKSEAGVWLSLSSSGSATVEAYDSATVEASGSATVEAYDSATVRAYGSATVRAYGSATVRASGSATVEAYDSATVEASGSATVRASGSATVRAYGSATVEASGSATVRAYGSATVRASGSATVEAYDSATVEASGSATVEAYGSATVRAYDSAGVHAHHHAAVTAGPHVAVHLHSAQATVTGGVLIDLTALDLTDPQTWCDHHGVSVADGRAVLYKATDGDLIAGQGHGKPTTYTIGADVTCADWRADNQCGGGLHLSPTPHQAGTYRSGPGRYVRVTATLADLRPINDSGAAKCKVRGCRVEAEVDAFGRELEEAVGR